MEINDREKSLLLKIIESAWRRDIFGLPMLEEIMSVYGPVVLQDGSVSVFYDMVRTVDFEGYCREVREIKNCSKQVVESIERRRYERAKNLVAEKFLGVKV